MKKKVGILGGMGPLATAKFFSSIVEQTTAKCDQEHIRVFIDNNPQIPDRTSYLLDGGESPVTSLIDSARRLENIGADFIVFPCNTSHYFYEEIQGAVDIPVLSMIEITARHFKDNGIREAVLLSTEGTMKAGVYGKVFKSHGIDLMELDNSLQTLVTQLIYAVKGDNKAVASEAYAQIIQRVRGFERKKIILGCTELPLVFDPVDVEFVDPMALLVKSTIEFAGYEVR